MFFPHALESVCGVDFWIQIKTKKSQPDAFRHLGKSTAEEVATEVDNATTAKNDACAPLQSGVLQTVEQTKGTVEEVATEDYEATTAKNDACAPLQSGVLQTAKHDAAGTHDDDYESTKHGAAKTHDENRAAESQYGHGSIGT